MGKFRVTAPDGQKYDITAPEGATEQQVLEYAKQQFAARPQQAKTYPGSYGFTGPAPNKGEYVSAADDPASGGITGALDSIDKATYSAGGRVTDLASKAGLPPSVAGAAGYAANVGIQAAPMAVGGATRALAGPIRNVARDLMQSALKPTIKTLKNGDAAVAIDTMLERGINPTKGGVELLKGKISELNDEIKNAIRNSTETVNKAQVGKTLLDLFNKFKSQVNPQADLDAIKKAWMEFRNHPLLAGKSEIPVQVAQDIKQGTYKQLSKKYGEMGSADVEAQKTLARGLKEGIAEKVPGIASLNAEETNLIKTLGVVERRALMELNKNPAGLALLAGHPGSFAAFMADKSALFKSLAARMIYSGAEAIPAATTEAVVGAGQVARGLRNNNQPLQ